MGHLSYQKVRVKPKLGGVKIRPKFIFFNNFEGYVPAIGAGKGTFGTRQRDAK